MSATLLSLTEAAAARELNGAVRDKDYLAGHADGWNRREFQDRGYQYRDGYRDGAARRDRNDAAFRRP